VGKARRGGRLGSGGERGRRNGERTRESVVSSTATATATTSAIQSSEILLDNLGMHFVPDDDDATFTLGDFPRGSRGDSPDGDDAWGLV
jgi:hypothetical protein